VALGKTFGICEACGSSAALPKESGDRIAPLEPLVRRAMLSLEYAEWAKADELLDQALNIDPECAEIYVARLMVEARVQKEEDLAKHTRALSEYVNYQKAVRFAAEELRTRLEQYNAVILERLGQEQEEKVRQAEVAAEAQAEEQIAQEKKKRRTTTVVIAVVAAVIILVAVVGGITASRRTAAFERLLELPYLIEIVNDAPTAAELQGRGLRLEGEDSVVGGRTYWGRFDSNQIGYFRSVSFSYARPGGRNSREPLALNHIMLHGLRTFDGVEIDFDNVEQMKRHFSQTYGVEVSSGRAFGGPTIEFTLDDVEVVVTGRETPLSPMGWEAGTITLRRG